MARRFKQKDNRPTVPFCLYLNKMDILRITHNESLRYKIIQWQSLFVRQVTVQYKWIQYCGGGVFFLLIHLDLALDHEMLLKLGIVRGRSFGPATVQKPKDISRWSPWSPRFRAAEDVRILWKPFQNKPGCCACCFDSLLCMNTLFPLVKTAL